MFGDDVYHVGVSIDCLLAAIYIHNMEVGSNSQQALVYIEEVLNQSPVYLEHT